MSSLLDYHRRHAQSLIELFGFQVPLNYSSFTQEFQASKRAGMMDASFVGKIRVAGKDRESLLHRLTTNEMRNMKAGEARVNVFTNAKGRVVDLVHMLAEEQSFLLLTSPGRAGTLQKWIEKYTFIEDVKTVDLTAPLGLLYLEGETCRAKLEQALSIDLAGFPSGHTAKISWQDVEILVHCPATASPARLHVIAPSENIPALWQALLSEFTPFGFSTSETLRIMQGIPAADHEIVDEYNPHEIGLYPFVNFEKGCYIGQEVIARLDSYQKVQRALIGVQSEIEASLLAGTTIWRQEQEIGRLTSVAPAPRGTGAIGLAVVRKSFAQPNTEVELKRDGESFPALVVKLPFGD
jgi:folate-binding protein YgfZ